MRQAQFLSQLDRTLGLRICDRFIVLNMHLGHAPIRFAELCC